jgi:hypothetical protein
MGDDLVEKAPNQYGSGFGFSDAARLEMEERIGIELADGCTVRADNVVGINFEFGLRVDLGLGTYNQVAIS